MQTAVVAVLAIGLVFQATSKEPQETTSQHHSTMTQRGDEAMGFSHEKTTHHFRLFKDGGAIEVNANDPSDKATRDQVQMHLKHIAHMFSTGDFNAPMFIHGTTPPGVPTMKELRDQIQYAFQETNAGARVRIETANTRALEAVHAFLRFQIAEHQTGDSTELTESAILKTK